MAIREQSESNQRAIREQSESNQRAVRGTPRHSGTTTYPRRSALIACNHRSSQAITGNHRQAQTSTYNHIQSQAIIFNHMQSTCNHKHSPVLDDPPSKHIVPNERYELGPRTEPRTGNRLIKATPTLRQGSGTRHQMSSEVIRGHHRSSEAIRGHQRQSKAINGHQRASEVIRGNHLRKRRRLIRTDDR